MPRKSQFLTFRWLKPHQFVAIFGTVGFLTLVSAYVVSVSLDQVNPLFPYISDTGSTVPTSCIFGLLLNCASVFAAITFFIRHQHVSSIATSECHAFTTLNDISLFLGFTAAFGMMVVGCFQETSVLTVHLIGAILVFGGGIIVCWLQCRITNALRKEGLASNSIYYLRVVLASLVTLFFITTFLGAAIASYVAGKKQIGPDTLHWDKNDKGYGWHLVSTFSEWLMAIGMFMFITTFFTDFKTFHLGTKFIRIQYDEGDSSPLHSAM